MFGAGGRGRPRAAARRWLRESPCARPKRWAWSAANRGGGGSAWAGAPRWTGCMRRAWRSAPCGPKPPPRRGRGGGPPSTSSPPKPAGAPRVWDTPPEGAGQSDAVRGGARRSVCAAPPPSQPFAPHSACDRGRPFRWTRSSRAENPPRPSLLDAASTPSAGPNTLRAAPKARTTPNTPPSSRTFDQPLSRPFPRCPLRPFPPPPLRERENRLRRRPASPGSLPRRHRLPRNIVGPAGRCPGPVIRPGEIP